MFCLLKLIFWIYWFSISFNIQNKIGDEPLVRMSYNLVHLFCIPCRTEMWNSFSLFDFVLKWQCDNHQNSLKNRTFSSISRFYHYNFFSFWLKKNLFHNFIPYHLSNYWAKLQLIRINGSSPILIWTWEWIIVFFSYLYKYGC